LPDERPSTGGHASPARKSSHQWDFISDQARTHQYLIISPTEHCRSEDATDRTSVGRRCVGDARLDYWGVYLDWFDYWLKGIDNGVLAMPKVQLYLIGRNAWRSYDGWPLGTHVAWYLDSDGRANSRYGDGRLSLDPPDEDHADAYLYDPSYPVQSTAVPSGAGIDAVISDQSEVELRQDVLVYTSEPLDGPLAVIGAVEVVLYVSSSAKDTDFTAKLVEVLPDGTAWNLADSIIRARYREGLDREVLMEPGETYELRFDLPPVGVEIQVGHRLRLEVSSSNFPHFERNLNTGGRNWDEVSWVVAENAVHHGPSHRSHILLPAVEGD
jgi:hypothetical protein